MPEISHYCPNTPFVIVGTQRDLRDDPITIENMKRTKRQKPILKSAGEKLKEDVNAEEYVECSALTQVLHTVSQNEYDNPNK